MARSERLRLHPIADELLPARWQAPRKRNHRCNVTPECGHWKGVARHAKLGAHHGRDASRDGAIPGSVSESNEWSHNSGLYARSTPQVSIGRFSFVAVVPNTRQN